MEAKTSEGKKKDKKGTSHEAQLKQLKRIEGQVRGISKMIEEKRYCIDILQQFKAIKSSLKAVERKVIGEHLDHCVYKAVSSKNKKEANEVIEEIKELMESVKK